MTKKNNYFGPHLMLDLGECDFDILVDKAKIAELLAELPGKIGMTRISKPDVRKHLDKGAKTAGVTGVVILAESHISVHTFPDKKYVFVDVFSCRPFDTEKTKKLLVRFFSSKKPVAHVVKRGI
ncbi:MAG: adenosylmethionine decarboxylase, partial [Nanoarchaeota archaeon]|nr:adenosylmethionine decarboxylase [Nanoarchaeota archaeon]